MPVNVRARQFYLRFLQGGYASSAGFYGGGVTGDTYGQANVTYGMEAGESTIPGVDYIVMPIPGSRPSNPAWLFRVGDTAKGFTAAVVDQLNPTRRLDTSSLVDAYLVLTEPLRSHGGGIWQKAFLLEWDEDNDVLHRQWFPDDLSKPGRYVVTIRLLFESGRYMSIEANDETMFEVYESIVSVPP
jgi:hypothetical protein